MSESLTLTHTLYTPQQVQDLQRPQVAITGRSNVGKSSLINTLAGRKHLAKISSSPGKTRSINLYWMEGPGLYLVDLPGYGYAKRSKQERELWAKLVDTYFQINQAHILGIIVLLDSRLNPQRLDLELVSAFKAQQRLLIPVLTKVDKTKMGWRSQIERTWDEIIASSIKPIQFSAKTGRGKGHLLECLQSLA